MQIDSLLHTVGDIVGKRINASPADADAIAKMFDIDSLAVTDSTAATSKDDGEQEQEEEDGWEEIDEMGVSLSNASDEN